jgi:hypothetical protein
MVRTEIRNSRHRGKDAAAAAEISVSSLNLQGSAGRAIAYGSLTPFKTTITP